MAGKMSRNKGQRGEREVAHYIENAIGVSLQRNLVQTRDGGMDLCGIPWLSIEVKFQEQLHVEQWWQQTLAQTANWQMPVLIYRQSRRPWIVVTIAKLSYNGVNRAVRVSMSIDDFCEWLKKATKVIQWK